MSNQDLSAEERKGKMSERQQMHAHRRGVVRVQLDAVYAEETSHLDEALSEVQFQSLKEVEWLRDMGRPRGYRCDGRRRSRLDPLAQNSP
jgi:hypothetical protein